MQGNLWRALCGALPVMLAAASSAIAQTPPAVVPPYSAGDALRESDETRRAAPTPRSDTPVLPQLVEPPFTLRDKERILIRRFDIQGAGPVSEDDIRAVLEPYENRRLTIADIYEAADKVTTLYRERGYLVAKAYVPAQDARKGVLKLKIIPGKYGTIDVRNESYVGDEHVRGVIDHALAGATFIHRDQLERAMLLTADLAGAGVPRVAIGAGKQPETADFVFDVPVERRVDGYALYDNYGPPWTGRNRVSVGINLNSPLGFGDRLSGFGLLSQDNGLVNGRAGYALPLGYDGLRAEIAAFRTTYVLGGVFETLGATGTADGVSATLAYPLLRREAHSLYLSGNYSHKSLEDKIFGVPLNNRTIDVGTAAVTNDTNSALFGLPLLTSTSVSITFGRLDFPDPLQRAANIAGIGTYGDYRRANVLFTATLGLIDRLSFSTTLRAQKTLSGSLDSSEQIAVTGFWAVKSFDEGVTGDSGYLVTPELKYALPDIQNYRHAISAFTDVGGVWIANPTFSFLPGYTQLSDIGASYNAAYEYMPGRAVLGRAMVAWTYGSAGAAQFYDNGFKALVQAGFTF